MAGKKPHLLQILEISLIQRKATALTLLGSGKLLRTEKKCSFITGGQRKNVLCPWHNFHPSKRSGSHFCGSAEAGAQLCCQSWGHPEGDHTWAKTPGESRDSTREMPVLQTQRTEDCQTLPSSFSCDLFLSLSAHFTSYISFASSGEEGRGSTNWLQGETNVSDAQVFSQVILCSLSTAW